MIIFLFEESIIVSSTLQTINLLELDCYVGYIKCFFFRTVKDHHDVCHINVVVHNYMHPTT